ncbi:alpha/beta fold hydrolase [Parerythrobacter jejuensis]|uniref:Alpha/beta fold hydrolase n=1 Tax=Parerythrobacter jejuensis TaxID=795812 RepID=A0A845ASV6_9SPHN|nr:alpha/beta hydrolase [Parerythrobacter jejuensis]MXP32579.1 alpha/beta fold hydrolase [Parerythrobacter jejuensis]
MDRQRSWSPEPESGISIEFVEANGLTFEVAQMEPASGESDHLALCLHGFPELHYSWRNQMPLLAEMGYRVWAPNMRGYGQTTRPHAVRDYGMDHLTQDVAGLIDASGAKSVTLIAHDWGGIIAWAFAIAKIRPLERLVIMNLPHPKVLERELKRWEQLRKSWYVFFFQLPWLPEKRLGSNNGKNIGELFVKTSCNPERFGPEERAVYAAAAAQPGAPRAMVNYYRAAMKHRGLVELGNYRVDIPTLMIWGEEDVALNIHCTEGTEEWVSDLTLKRLPNVSHWVQQDAPEQVNAILSDWLPAAS